MHFPLAEIAAPGVGRRRSLLVWLAIAPIALGCGRKSELGPDKIQPPTVRLVRPTLENIVRVVGQPSFVVAYERTSIFPKVTGFIEKWNVDISDKVRKDQVLATLFVPELVEDLGTKKATVEYDKQRIALALDVVQVADAEVKAAEASLLEAKEILAKFEAQVDRWQSEVDRLARETRNGVVDPQVLLESRRELKADVASRSAAAAAIAKADADLVAKQRSLVKSKTDVDVARADLSVAESEVRRLQAWVGYLELRAPYDGVIEARNANTFDFVMPSAGDPTAMRNAPHLSPENAAPIYVVDRTDIVRIFVDVPERDANYVQIGTKASVLIRAFRDIELPASVTRTSWALNETSRTLRAEIDLPNTDSQILPGMYAYANIVVERHVRALPVGALVLRGDQSFYWSYDHGRAVRTQVQTGISDGKWVEVTNRRKASARTNAGYKLPWSPMDEAEQVIISGDLAAITEGQIVKPIDAESQSVEDAAASQQADATAKR